jgi:hypothetical protein
MRITRDLLFVTLVAFFIHSQQAPVQAGLRTCTTGWQGCVDGGAQCSPTIIDCTNLCRQNCPGFDGHYDAQGLQCNGQPDNGCPNPGPNPGQNMFVQGSCACEVSCYDDGWGCGSDSDCCNGYCNPETYVCGDQCYPDGWGCGSNADCCNWDCSPYSYTCCEGYDC